MAGSLGRTAPPDWVHVEKFPLTAGTAPAEPVPGVIGIDWFSDFDRPQLDGQGHYWIGRDAHNLGTVRGGHCISVRKRASEDPNSWWAFYDQDDPDFVARIKSPHKWKEGACTGFGTARMLSHYNRRRYDPYFLYYEAQKIDEWPGEGYEGSSVRAALDVARTLGAARISRGAVRPPDLAEGISANRWATDTQDFLDAVGYGAKGYIELLNSWGRSGYPHIVRMPAETLDVLRQRDGELGIPTDR